jgi:exopolysaccharide biosynthesis polyprenyl glycosylphosphotransferase
MKNNTSLVYNVCLILGDFLALVVAFVVAYILRVTLSHVPISAHVQATTYISIVVTILPFWILIFALLGLYNSKIHENRFSEFGRLVVGCLIGILLVISYSYLANVVIFPARLVTIYGFLLAFVFVVLFRTIARGIRRDLFTYGIGINDVLIVGDTRLSHELVNSLANTSKTGYRVVGIVGGKNHPLDASLGHRVFASFSEAIHALSPKPHTIVQTELYAAATKNDEILVYAQQQHLDYRFVPGNSELFVGNIDVELFQGVPVIAVNQTALIGWGRVIKRIFDVFLGGILLVLAAPFMLIIAIIIRLSGSGPIFFRQTRLTRNNQHFKVYKFRTVKAAYNGLSPEDAFAKMGKPELALDYRENGDYLPHDPRFTPFARFLRTASLDELPQLINVVKGDISLVGPRALVPEELAIYQKRHAILSVKSGLTGLAQVSGRRDISFDERRKLDLFYVQNWSFWNDIVILIRTVWIVLFHQGSK